MRSSTTQTPGNTRAFLVRIMVCRIAGHQLYCLSREERKNDAGQILLITTFNPDSDPDEELSDYWHTGSPCVGKVPELQND